MQPRAFEQNENPGPCEFKFLHFAVHRHKITCGFPYTADVLLARNTGISSMTDQSRSYYVQKRADLCVKVCRELYRHVHGREASIKYRKEVSDMKDPTLTFGEIVPQSFMQILKYTTRDDEVQSVNRKFVDLGSGTGRACVCAALSPFGFQSVVGVELMPGLHGQAEGVLASLRGIIAKASTSTATSGKSAQKKIVQPVAATDFDNTAVDVLRELTPIGQDYVQTDYFANALTKRLGHKVFKATMKEHRSFSKYLQGRTALFSLSVDGKSVQLAATSAAAGSDIADDNEERDAGNLDSDTFTHIVTAERSTTELESAHCLQAEANCINPQGVSAAQDTTPAPDGVTAGSFNTTPLQLSQSDAQLLQPLPNITFHCGDMFALDWRDADVVYAASLLFSTPMMETLTLQASQLRPGAWVISLKPLLLEECRERLQNSIVLRTAEWYKMSWQMAKVYMYQVC
jgi:SAM-dependent methyltransferase